MKSGLAHDGCRSDNKQAPEIAVSLFGYAAEFFFTLSNVVEERGRSRLRDRDRF